MTDKDQADEMFRELRQKLMEAYAAEFQSRPELAGGGQPQIVFQAVYVATLIDVAAEIGIDAGMPQEVFEATAQESHQRGLQNAPTFG